MFAVIYFLSLFLYTFDINAASDRNHETSQPINIPEDKKRKIARKIDDGRLIAGYAYKTSREKRQLFIDANPRIKELIKYSVRIVGTTGSKTSPLRSECAFVAQALTKTGIVDWGHFIVSIRGTKGMNTSDWSTNFSTALSSANLRSIEEPDSQEEKDEENIEFENQLLQEDYFQNTASDITSSREIKTHSGFYRYASSMVDDIWHVIYKRLVDHTLVHKKDPEPIINALKNIRISIYGHSLGGAAAQIVALQLRQKILSQLVLVYEQNSLQMKETLLGKIKVYSYESPLVFNQAGSDFFNQKIGEKNHIRIVQRSYMSSGVKAVSNLITRINSIFNIAKNSLETVCSRPEELLFPSQENTSLRQSSQASAWLYDPITQLPGSNTPTGITCKVNITGIKAKECAEIILHKMMPVSHDMLNYKCFLDLVR